MVITWLKWVWHDYECGHVICGCGHVIIVGVWLTILSLRGTLAVIIYLWDSVLRMTSLPTDNSSLEEVGRANLGGGVV